VQYWMSRFGPAGTANADAMKEAARRAEAAKRSGKGMTAQLCLEKNDWRWKTRVEPTDARAQVYDEDCFIEQY
jgi:hypothetical protein